MVNRSTVVLGMSGGVDSSVAAAILVEQGYEVQGVTLQVWENEDESTQVSKRWEERGCCKVGLARHVAKLLNIPHQVVDSRELFQKGVIDNFVEGYLSGTTPNPCVRCNERVKFGSLYHFAKAMGADYVATGHYARLHRSQHGKISLARAEDQKKDQSYFLYRISPAWLPNILFPIGNFQKTEVWSRAEAMGLPTDELKESQEICFVTQGDYRSFLRVNVPSAIRPGTFVDTTGQSLGTHDGIAFYTPGQRRGLGISTGERLFVHRVIPETNTVVLGPSEGLTHWECRVSDLNIFDSQDIIDGSNIDVKIRYATPSVPATITWEETGSAHIRFSTPQRALSPGQSAVFYRGDHVLGGGIIQQPISTNEHTHSPSQFDTHPIASH